MYDMIIIGAGPAGAGAAIYAKRAGFDVLVIDKNPMSGGQVLITTEIDNYLGLPGIGGFELGMKFKEHMDALEIPMVAESVSSIDMEGTIKVVKTGKNTYEAKTLVLATGASHMKLGVPGEKEFTGKGVSYCATCDGAFFRGLTTAVVGGGDVALTDAIFLSRFCKKVYVIHRRDSLRAAKRLQMTMQGIDNIEVIWNTRVEEIKGEVKVEKLLLQRTDSEEKSELEVDGIFIAVGNVPNNELFSEKILCDEKGYIKAGENCLTSITGVAAVGDVRTKELRQIITAVADGANAVSSLESYIL